MDDTQQQFKKDARGVHLFASEKEAIKRRIVGVPAPREYYFPFPAFSFASFNFAYAGRMAMAALLVSILGAAPLTYAAQQSSPGDALYHFELYVVEPIEEAFQFSPNARIAYSADRLEERLQEIQATGHIDVSAEEMAIVVENIEEHAQDVLSALEEDSADAATDDIVRASALLGAHENLIAEVSQEETRIKNFDDVVAAELRDQIAVYANEATPLELVEAVRGTVSETTEILERGNFEAAATDIAALLTGVEEEIAEGDFIEALQEATEAKVQALAQEYSEQAENMQE